MNANFNALIFDCDGVIAETESEGHRVAFNKVFTEEELGVTWDVETYGEKLEIAGGKERMRTLFAGPGALDVPNGDLDACLKRLHRRKTDLYMEMIEKGELPGRAGVRRLAEETHARGIRLAIASTSNERGVTLLAKRVFGEEAFGWIEHILAGDVVARKKPDPEIYLLAAERLGVEPDSCCVVEDTDIGLAAAKGAGMKCLVTRSYYSRGQAFPEAELAVDGLDEGPVPVSIETIANFFTERPRKPH